MVLTGFDSSNGNIKVKDYMLTGIQINIPGYNQFEYVAALESITMDNNKNIYLVDDPWRMFYVPREIVLKKLDNETVSNFKKFIPIIFKFKLIASAS